MMMFFANSRLPALRDVQILTSDMKQKQAESIMLYIMDVLRRRKSKRVSLTHCLAKSIKPAFVV